MENCKYCKLCLVTDVKMLNINTPSFLSLLEAYTQLAQFVCDGYQVYACYECVSLLRKYQEFRSKCMTALNLLSSIDKNHSKITKQVLQNIDRHQFNLQSKLGRCDILLCNSTDQMLIPRDCLNSEDDLYNININKDIKIEFDTPKTEFKINVCDPTHDTQNHIISYDSVSNEIIPKSNDNESDDNDYVPEIKKKRIQSPQLKKSKEKFAKFNTDQEQNAIKKKFVKRSRKTKSKDKQFSKKEKLAEDFMNQFKGYATVVNLTPEDAKKELLLRKESSNYKINPHKCDFCYKGFTVKSTFDNHMKKHSPEYGSEECEYCHQRFSKKKLREHIFTSHKRKYICSICPYVSFSSTQAIAHMNCHKGQKYECRECGLTFSMPNSLSNHKRVKHPTETVCVLCGSMFASLKGMNAHQKLSHRQDNIELVGPKCAECDVQFATETAWKRHLVLSSKHTVLNGCEACGEIFPSRRDLKIHSKLHPLRKTDNKRYKFNPPAACKICNKWLTTRKEYTHHMTSQHPPKEPKPPAVCEVCGMSFKSSQVLGDHQLLHTGERPYECRECGKTFRQRTVLYQHENMHTRKRVYQCDLCQKQYYAKGPLVKHIKAHLGIRPYECSFCHKFFPQKYELRMHIDYVHRKEPWPKRDRSKRKVKQQSVVL